jgi:ankyrin repeat protein
MMAQQISAVAIFGFGIGLFLGFIWDHKGPKRSESKPEESKPEELEEPKKRIRTMADTLEHKLMEASFYGNLEQVQQCISSGVDINHRDLFQFSNTALMVALNYANYDIVELLVKNGADVNIQNCYRNTVFIFACDDCNIKIMKFLVDNGANINIRNRSRQTALIRASIKNSREVVKWLLERGADTEDALDVASTLGNREIVAILFDHICAGSLAKVIDRDLLTVICEFI